MKVLVTGHLGYIGTVMTPRLLEAGHEVVGLDSDLYSRCTFHAGGRIEPVPELKKDIREVEVEDLIGFDAVIHLAGLSNDPLGDLYPNLTDAINNDASVQLARQAKEAGVRRFVFSSSCSVYGEAGDHFVDEEGALHPATPYARSKIEAEIGIARLADDTFSPTFMRNATAYGVSPRIRFDLVLNNLVAWAHCTGRIHLKSDGSAWRPIAHVEDISSAFLAVLHAERSFIHNEVFNVGSTEHNYRVIELAEIVGEVLPHCVIDFADDAQPDCRCYRVNFDKIKARLPAFQPQWDAKRAAQSLVDAYRAGNLQLEEFEGTRYQRIGHVRQLLEMGELDHTLRLRSEVGSRWAHATCRSCKARGLEPIMDLGEMPLSDGLVPETQLEHPDPHYPLEVGLCPACHLMQIIETVEPDVLFGADYLYFSSFSDTWMKHCRENAFSLIDYCSLNADSLVVEIASNDGYLLGNFVERGIPVLGIDPAPGPVAAAREKGVPTEQAFFSRSLAQTMRDRGQRADLIIANNVLAHVKELNGVVEGISLLLKETGTLVLEFPYVKDLVDEGQFDTIYHQHLCYFSVHSAKTLLERHGLFVNHVQRLSTHGGSLRLYVSKQAKQSPELEALLLEEKSGGLLREEYYQQFAARVLATKKHLRELMQRLKAEGKRIAAYGAAAKGTILVNYMDLGSDVIDFVVDRNIHKQGRYMPGKRLRIYPPSKICEEKPDYLLILPWNLSEEIMQQQAEFRNSGGRFILPISEPTVV